jgi:hypothetical protein
MNTLEEDIYLDPMMDSYDPEPEILPESNVSINEMEENYEPDFDLNIQSPMSENIDPSVQITPKPQDQIKQNSIQPEYDPSQQMSQSNANAQRNTFTDARFNGPEASGAGNGGRISSDTQKPSPMASSRAMDTKLRIANNASPEWRQHYV